jgi:hypothetical protein
LVKGRTVLIQNDQLKGNIPQNYRPITCLPTIWKLISGILADTIMGHMTFNHLMAPEQKGIRPGSRGTKDQLIIDQLIANKSKRRKKNLAVAWIDYKKAYDSVPHSWIFKILQIYKIHQSICALVQQSMQHWTTVLTCGSESLAKISIQCGIFQGDAL